MAPRLLLSPPRKQTTFPRLVLNLLQRSVQVQAEHLSNSENCAWLTFLTSLAGGGSRACEFLELGWSPSLSVCSSCRNKYHRLGGVSSKHLHLTVWEPRSTKSRCQQIRFLWQPSSWLEDNHLLLCPHMAKREMGRGPWSFFLFF